MKSVVAHNITKSYGALQVLKGIDFEVDQGEIFGIIGADGAGKTTLFRILTTLLLADSGSASVDGLDVVVDYKQIRHRVGYMPGRFSLYQDMSVRENMEFFAAVFNTTVDQNYHLVEDIYKQIEPFKDRRAGKLSGGMKQKLALCCSLIHAPSVLFLDEPTTGVDPTSRGELWVMLKRLKTQGITIVVSTPYMDEAKQCDRIAFIRSGSFLGIDTPANMVANFGEILYRASATNMYRLLLDIRAFSAIKRCYTFGANHHFTANDAKIDELKNYLIQKDHQNLAISRCEPTIEDCYMKMEYEWKE